MSIVSEKSLVTAVSTAPRDFFDYVVKGEIERVTDAIKLNEDLVYSRNAGGSTALHMAVFHAEYAIARLLIAKGADIDAENNVGRTPMSYDRAKARLDLLGNEKKRADKDRPFAVHPGSEEQSIATTASDW